VADVTDLLNRWSSGDSGTFDELMPVVYNDLKTDRDITHETLDCPALVHETYLRSSTRRRCNGMGELTSLAPPHKSCAEASWSRPDEDLADKHGAGAVHEQRDDTLAVTIMH